MAGVQILHATAGRLRIKPAVAKSDTARAGRLLERLRAVQGVLHVEINPVTRNAIILYEPRQVSQQALFGQLELLFGGPLRLARRGRPVSHGSELRSHIAHTLLKSAMEAAVQRAVLALI